MRFLKPFYAKSNTMRILILGFLLTVLSCSTAQTPEPAKKAFQDKYPNAKDVTWSVDRNGYEEADFKLDGVKYRADFTKAGEWVETETSVKWDDLPDAVKEAFKDEDKKKDIVEIEFVNNSKKGEFYDIEFKRGSGKLDITIRPDGTVIGTDNQ